MVNSSKILNVCVVNPNYYRSSGVTTAIRRIYEGSLNHPIEWYFIDCQYGNAIEKNYPEWIPACNLFKIKLMSYNPFILIVAIIKFLRFLKANSINIIHVHHRRLAIIIGLIGELKNIKVVYTGQLTYKNNYFLNLLPDITVTGITQSVQNNIINSSNKKNVHVISNPAYIKESFQELEYNELITVTCIARLEPVKNHETLLNAWALSGAEDYNASLLIVGEGPLKSPLIELTKKLGIFNSVKFLGYVSDVSNIINQSNFLILPSWVEGQGIVIIEAAGMGRPTLVTNVDGSRDCIPDNITLPNKIDPSSPIKLADALRYWFENPYKVINDGKQFYDFWKNECSPNVIADKYYKLYLNILK